jgi:hypothetical protein
MRVITRDQAINAIRAKLLTLVDDQHSMCEVAGRLHLYCGGFSQFTTGELRKRFHWIVENRPAAKRDEVEDLANRWQLARQYVTGSLIACDTQAQEHEKHHTCQGWMSFSDEKLAEFHRDLLGEAVEIVPAAAPPAA